MCSLGHEFELLIVSLSPIQKIVNFALKSIKVYRNCAPISRIYVIYIKSAFSSR